MTAQVYFAAFALYTNEAEASNGAILSRLLEIDAQTSKVP
jgi:hypothetical protein